MKIYKRNKSRQTISGSLMIVFMLVLSALFIGMSVLNTDTASATANDYLYYKTLTIESDYVDATLTNFPICVNVTSSDFADNILASGADIAFYDSTKTVRFNHEVEVWNKSQGELVAWVNVTSVSHTADTTLYMYYGDSDTGDSLNYYPTSVWDTNYTAVYHMNASTTKTSGCYDSTANANHGTYNGNLPTTIGGKQGYGQDFDGENDYIVLPSGCKLENNDYGTVESLVELDTVSGLDNGVWVMKYAEADQYAVCRMEDSDQKWFFDGVSNSAHQWELDSLSTAGLTFTYLAQGMKLYDVDHWVNGTIDATNSTCNMPHGTFEKFYIGVNENLAHDMDGTIDEFRISNDKRSDSWIKASYNSVMTVGFLTAGAQQSSGESTYSIKGVTDDIVTWDGIAITTVWSNSSGDYSETMEYNMSVNSTQNVTNIRVYVSDLNNSDSSKWLNASNISLYISSDNSSFGSLGTFVDGGSNLTINTTNWNAGTMGADPFTDGGGITDRDDSIYLRFKFVIPAGTTATDYWSSSGTAYKIHSGHLV